MSGVRPDLHGDLFPLQHGLSRGLDFFVANLRTSGELGTLVEGCWGGRLDPQILGANGSGMRGQSARRNVVPGWSR
jgi:hypothetical protein